MRLRKILSWDGARAFPATWPNASGGSAGGESTVIHVKVEADYLLAELHVQLINETRQP